MMTDTSEQRNENLAVMAGSCHKPASMDPTNINTQVATKEDMLASRMLNVQSKVYCPLGLRQLSIEQLPRGRGSSLHQNWLVLPKSHRVSG